MSKVMVISSGGPSWEARLGAYLGILRTTGQIAGYTVFDHQGLPQGPDLFAAYDVAIVHRWLPRSLHPVFAGRRLPFLFDADEAPVSALSRFGGDLPQSTPLCETLFLAKALLSPSPRLPEVVGWHCGLAAPNAAIIPYAFPGGLPPRRGPVRGLFFSSWRDAFLGDSRAAALAAIDAFSTERGVPVFNCSRERGLFRRECWLGGLAVWELEAHLRSVGPVIAAVPLETCGGPFLEDYLSCRPDLEKAFYGSLGVAGVYSAAPSFVESDLATGTLVPNESEAWHLGLQQAWERVGDPAFANAAGILAQRTPEKIATQCLLPVLTAWSGQAEIRPGDVLVAGR